MIARLVEDWLTKVNERQLEIPFCHLLASQGYRVVHLSRHGEMEQGKDVIAISPDNQPCAYQLKTAGDGKIRLRDWEQFLPQIGRLVELPIVHPAVPANAGHRSYLVTNGELDEPVRLEVDQRNRHWQQNYGRTLEVVVKGQILQGLIQLQTDFWPKEPEDIKALLEFFLESGRGLLAKDKFAALVWRELPFGETLGPPQLLRAVSSAAILSAYSLAPYAREMNHVAQVEGWTIFAASIFALAERLNLPQDMWEATFKLVEEAIFRSLEGLWEEVRARTSFVEGDPISDVAVGAFLRARMTLTIGMLAAWGLWLRFVRRQPSRGLLEEIQKHARNLWLWGESAVPYFLCFMWFMSRGGGGIGIEQVPIQLLGTVARAQSGHEKAALPDSYHWVDEVIRVRILERDKFEEDFHGRSYSLESLVMLVARRLWRQLLDSLWPEISRVAFASFEPEHPYNLYEWHSRDGTLVTEYPKLTQSWGDLLRRARTARLEAIPPLMVQHPHLLMLFTLVYPHRLNAEIVKFLDDWVSGLPRVDD